MIYYKNRIVIAITLLLIVGFLATCLFSFFVARDSLRSKIDESELPLTSDNIYSEIHRDLLRPVFVAFNMAHDTFLRDWILNGEKDASQLTRYLSEVKSKNGTISSFFVSDKTGSYYHAGGLLKRISPEDPRDRWFYRVKNMRSDYEINIDVDMANRDAMTIFINYHVVDYQGQFLGATGVGLTVNAVSDLIGKYQQTYGRNVFFIDTLGNIKLHSGIFPDSIKSLNQIANLNAYAEQILYQRTATLNYRRNGQTIHINTRYIPEFNWILVVEQSEESSLKPIWRALITNLILCSLITVIIVGIIWRILSVYQNKLETAAQTDKLTGAYNRRAFSILAEQIQREYLREQKTFSMVLFDVDFFKKVNDAYGHRMGDEVLVRICELTRAQIRRSDLFCRWGGEEFLLVLRGCSGERAFHMAEQIRLAIQEESIELSGERVSVTISLGATEYRADESVDQWISRCDKLLYQAKAEGRNRTVVG